MNCSTLLSTCALLVALHAPAYGQLRPVERFPVTEHSAFMALPPKALEADYSSADAFLLRVLGAMAGTAAGGLAARGLWWICDELAGECPHAAWIPALALTAAGTSTGVALMAERAGRSPAWSYTLAGAGLGSVPGAVIMMRWGEGSDINTGVALMIFVPSVLVGSLVGNYVGQ